MLAAETTAVLEADQADASELAHEARRMITRPCGDLPWAFDVETRVASRWSDAHRGGLASDLGLDLRAVDSTTGRLCSRWG